MKTADLVTGIQHLGIPTKDMDGTVEFYKGLGFEVEWSAANPDHNVAFLRLKDLVIETYLSAEATGTAGAIDHVSLNVEDIDAVYEDIKSGGYNMLHDEIQFLSFFQYGVRFFTIEGPNAERIEFNEILKCGKNMRDEALRVFREHNKGEYRLFHALSVEAAMRYFAGKRGEDVEYWGAVGLLHDLDFEEHPGQHCKKNPEMLAAAGYDDKFIHAVQSHGFNTSTDVEPELFMEKVLYTMNELAELVSESAFALPTRSVYDLTVNDVKEKFSLEGFAPRSKRGPIKKGCEMMGRSLDAVAADTISGMRAAAKDLGLDGSK